MQCPTKYGVAGSNHPWGSQGQAKQQQQALPGYWALNNCARVLPSNADPACMKETQDKTLAANF